MVLRHSDSEKKEVGQNFSESNLSLLKSNNNIETLFSLEGKEINDRTSAYVAYGNGIIVLLTDGYDKTSYFVKIYQSEDNGKSWENVYNYSSSSRCRSYGLWYIGNNIFIAISQNNYFFISTDQGRTWQKKDFPVSAFWTGCIYFQNKIIFSNRKKYYDKDEFGVIYRCGTKLVYSSDLGETWIESELIYNPDDPLMPSFPNGGISVVNDKVYLPFTQGYFYSEDLSNWHYVDVGLFGHSTLLSVVPSKIIGDGTEFYCMNNAGEWGIYEVEDPHEVELSDIIKIEGNNAIPKNKPFGSSLRTASEYNGEYYFFYPKAIYKLNSNNTFTKVCDVNIPDGYYYSKNLFVYSDNIFFLQCKFKGDSHDVSDCIVWKIYKDPETNEYETKTVLTTNVVGKFATDPTYIYIYGDLVNPDHESYMYRSGDIGETWTELPAPTYIHEMIYANGKLWGISLAIEYSNKLYYSTNHGETWEYIMGDPPLEYNGMYFLKKGNTIVTYPVRNYSGEYEYFNYSLDNGSTWNFITMQAVNWGELFIIDSKSLTLYRVRGEWDSVKDEYIDNMVYLSASTDFGETWSEYTIKNKATFNIYDNDYVEELNNPYIGNDSFLFLDNHIIVTFDPSTKQFTERTVGNSSFFQFYMYKYDLPFPLRIGDTNQIVKIDDDSTFRTIPQPNCPIKLHASQRCADYVNGKYILVYASDFDSPIGPPEIAVLSSYDLDNYNAVYQVAGKKIKINPDNRLYVMPDNTLLLPVITYSYSEGKRLDLLAIPC